MGQPGGAQVPSLVFERERTRGTETSQYPEEEKSTEMSVVAASEPDPSLNRGPLGLGVVGPTDAYGDGSRSSLERDARDGESPVARS